MQKIMQFLKTPTALLLACCLVVLTVVGAAALLLSGIEQESDGVQCTHGSYQYKAVEETADGDNLYFFHCNECLQVFREQSSTSAFMLHTPSVVNGAVSMSAPWETGAYYKTKDGGQRYALFNKRADYVWITDGTLWEGAVGLAFRGCDVFMTSSHQGNCSISYIAEKDGFVHPGFEAVRSIVNAASADFYIAVNGEKVFPADGYMTIPVKTNCTADFNNQLADLWISVEAGDRVSFVMQNNGTGSQEFIVYPTVEIMTHSPART